MKIELSKRELGLVIDAMSVWISDYQMPSSAMRRESQLLKKLKKIQEDANSSSKTVR